MQGGPHYAVRITQVQYRQICQYRRVTIFSFYKEQACRRDGIDRDGDASLGNGWDGNEFSRDGYPHLSLIIPNFYEIFENLKSYE